MKTSKIKINKSNEWHDGAMALSEVEWLIIWLYARCAGTRCGSNQFDSA